MKETKSKSVKDDTNERKVESETTKRADGMSETDTTTTTKHKAEGKTRKNKTKEKTVRDADGNVVEHEKKTN